MWGLCVIDRAGVIVRTAPGKRATHIVEVVFSWLLAIRL